MITGWWDAPDNSIDAILTDGPYALVSIVKRFGSANSAPAKGNEAFARASKGFMGKTWDTGEVVNDPAFWAECLRVLKPGGHLLSFGGTRTYHRMACAVEDAGFEIRDMIQWLYGSGFPKSHDVSKGIDKAAGAVRESLGKVKGAGSSNTESLGEFQPEYDLTAPATPAAQVWEGWGTALKPANEPIVLARKPLSEKTVAANVLKWGTGAINIDGCRVEHVTVNGGNLADNPHLREVIKGGVGFTPGSGTGSATRVGTTSQLGRFPANVITDGSEEVVGAFPSAPGQLANVKRGGTKTANVYGKMNREGEASADKRYTNEGSTNFAPLPGQRRNDSGSAARFFYQAKASKKDRAGSKHPTVKPIALMRYLARLITPPGGTILDPFAGSGTTGEAAYLEGFNCYLIEREAEYVADIAQRFAVVPIVEQPANDNDELSGKIDLEEAIADAA